MPEKIGLQSLFETSEFQKGLDTYIKGVAAAEGKTTMVAANIGNSIAGAAGKFIVGAGVLAAAGIAALGAGLYSTIGPASDLNETMSKATVVFGAAADKVIAFGQTSAKSLGMSTNAALTAAGTYGNLFRAMGMTETTSADMSTSLVQLAGDLASFNNMDPTEVMDKLRAGLSGESEPLKSLGVNINENIIKQKAMELGLVGYGKELTAATKAQAVYALIMEQTSLAQGDFARTSGGLANQQRIAAANIENLRAKIGTALLPAVQKAAGLFNSFINSEGFQTFIQNAITAITAFVDKISLIIGLLQAGFIKTALIQAFGPEVYAAILQIQTILQQVGTFLQANWQPIVAGIATVLLGFLVPAFIAWATAAGTAAIATITALAPVVLPILAIGAAVGVLVAAWNGNWFGIRDTLTAVWTGTIQPALQALWTWLSTNVPLAINTLVTIWNTVLLPALMAVWGWVQANLIPLFQAIADLISTVVSVAVAQLASMWSTTLLPALQSVANAISKNLQPVMDAIAKFISEKLMPIFNSVNRFLQNEFVAAFNAVTRAVQWLIEQIRTLIDNLGKLKPPKDFTPGSPTPFELGLRGINAAMEEINKQALPSLNANLAGVESPASTSSGLARAAASQVTNTNIFQLGGNTIANGMDAATFEASVRLVVERMLP